MILYIRHTPSTLFYISLGTIQDTKRNCVNIHIKYLLSIEESTDNPIVALGKRFALLSAASFTFICNVYSNLANCQLTFQRTVITTLSLQLDLFTNFETYTSIPYLYLTVTHMHVGKHNEPGQLDYTCTGE